MGSSDRSQRSRRATADREIRGAVTWFFGAHLEAVYGARALPFYCDRDSVGDFAVAPNDLAAGDDAAVFRLFVTLSMYKARRDVVIMRQQRSMPRASMRVVADAGLVKRSITNHECSALRSAVAFERAAISRGSARSQTSAWDLEHRLVLAWLKVRALEVRLMIKRRVVGARQIALDARGRAGKLGLNHRVREFTELLASTTG